MPGNAKNNNHQSGEHLPPCVAIQRDHAKFLQHGDTCKRKRRSSECNDEGFEIRIHKLDVFPSFSSTSVYRFGDSQYVNETQTPVIVTRARIITAKSKKY